MTQMELAADILQRNLEMVKMTLSDFSDADMMVRPCPGANHPAWQLGHLINVEAGALKNFNPSAPSTLPPDFEKKFTKETCGKDDASLFPRKAELLDQFAKTRGAIVASVKTLKPADLDKPCPEHIRNIIPTVGHLVAMLPVHTAMHLGQFQVARRKLGKPILF